MSLILVEGGGTVISETSYSFTSRQRPEAISQCCEFSSSVFRCQALFRIVVILILIDRYYALWLELFVSCTLFVMPLDSCSLRGQSELFFKHFYVFRYFRVSQYHFFVYPVRIKLPSVFRGTFLVILYLPFLRNLHFLPFRQLLFNKGRQHFHITTDT